MNKEDANRLIRLAFEQGEIIYTEHAQQRMTEREISNLMVRKALKEGFVTRPPEHSVQHDNYKCRVENRCAGMNYAVIVAISTTAVGGIIITVMEV